MKEEKIIINIDTEGNATIEVVGVTGTKCLAMTEELENFLGIVVARETKPEMNQRPVRVAVTKTQSLKR